MGLIIREITGWVLLLLGLNIFYISFGYIDQGKVVEGSTAAFIGVFVFRGGLQLMKVAVAARAVLNERNSN